MYRLPSERIPLALDDGPTVEVERIAAWPIYRTAISLVGAFYDARTPDAEIAALSRIYGYFVVEAQPVWDIADHRGPIPATPEGMLRLPLAIALGLVQGWAATFLPPEPPTTAVDEVIPPGPLRDELNASLRRKRKV